MGALIAVDSSTRKQKAIFISDFIIADTSRTVSRRLFVFVLFMATIVIAHVRANRHTYCVIVILNFFVSKRS